VTGNPQSHLCDLLAVGDSLVEEPTGTSLVLADRLPWLAHQIRTDARFGRFDVWGRSTAIDRTTGRRVIPPHILEQLAELAGLTSAWPVCNAGLMHVYGYLLSATPTFHGPKRDRWLTPQLPTALGLDATAFAPWGHPSTALDRVAAVARPVLNSPGDDEDVRFWCDESDGSITTRTVVVCRGSSRDAALVYGVNEGQGMRLVTIFPIAGFSAAGFEEEWIAQWLSEPPRLRYNAVALDLQAGAPLADRHVSRG
jgi:hypothetical protein